VISLDALQNPAQTLQTYVVKFQADGALQISIQGFYFLELFFLLREQFGLESLFEEKLRVLTWKLELKKGFYMFGCEKNLSFFGKPEKLSTIKRLN